MPLSQKQFREDLEFMYTTIMDVHPKPDWRVPMSVLESEMDRARRDVVECRTEVDLWRLLRRFLHRMGDAHTTVWPPFGPSHRILPITTTLIDGHVVVEDVVDSSIATEIERGDVILACDGIDADARLEMEMAESVYNNGAWGRISAAHGFTTIRDHSRDQVTLVLAKSSGDVESTELPIYPHNHAVMEAFELKQKRRKITANIETNFLDDMRAGVMSYRACFDRQMITQERDFQLGLDMFGITLDDVPDMEDSAWSFFTNLRQRSYTRFILDIRGNAGGASSIGDILLKYLTRDDVRTYGCDVKISRQIQERNDSFSEDTPGVLRQYPNEPLIYPFHSRLSEDQLAALELFEGDVVVLTDERVFSSGEMLAAVMKANKLGTIVGEPTGGGGTVPGDGYDFKLPNTGLSLGSSFKLFRMPEGADQGYPGVLPDHWVKQTLDDYRAGRDTAMEYVKARWS
jgi:hypothetical protein